MKESRKNYEVEDLFHWALEKDMHSLPMNSNDRGMHRQERIIVTDSRDFYELIVCQKKIIDKYMDWKLYNISFSENLRVDLFVNIIVLIILG